jgi:hypothetical protein
MTTQSDGLVTSVGLLSDGNVVGGAAGTYPVANHARPRARVVRPGPTEQEDST